MTLGILAPLILAVFSLGQIMLFFTMRAGGRLTTTAFVVYVLTAIIFPIFVYGILNLLMPEWGATQVF